jgi:hypothetical protein
MKIGVKSEHCGRLAAGIDDVHIFLDSFKQACARPWFPLSACAFVVWLDRSGLTGIVGCRHYLPTERAQFTSAYKRAR